MFIFRDEVVRRHGYAVDGLVRGDGRPDLEGRRAGFRGTAT